ncbi:HDR024Wp [Eremothecium sinecaudum]|uniref:HDR024Wp n=1 Tax=Eremothecium sinecaudum TaxID=45286 RepID=A0A0X8HSM5_9SACH|nr:HDR024Wp [Eremothecium sinecaudum]AMD20767.1 HDR024Wp [Eremothecium sinecaudum]
MEEQRPSLHSHLYKHQWADTITLLLVCLSFNILTVSCLLIVFILATTSQNFISLWLSVSNSTKYIIDGVDIFDRANTEQKVPTVSGKNSKKALVSKNQQVFSAGYDKPPGWSFGRRYLGLEIVLAWIFYGLRTQYFMIPIENFAISIIASTLINDKIDTLKHAVLCSILYIICTKLLEMPTNDTSISSMFSENLPVGMKPLKFINALNPIPILIRHVPFLKYALSFHIVAQFYVNIKCFVFKPIHLFYNTDMEVYGNAAEIATTVTGTGANTKLINLKGIAANEISGAHSAAVIDLSPIQQTSTYSSNFTSASSKTPVSYLTSFVDEVNISQFPLDAVDTNDTVNEHYNISLNYGEDQPVFDLIRAITDANIGTFIYKLFKDKNKYPLPPLWSMFTAFKIMWFKKTCLTKDTVNFNSSVCSSHVNDYNTLNIIPKTCSANCSVCITSIGSTSITFCIDNITNGELIILVNGVIWPQVFCAEDDNYPRRLHTLVSGLIPSSLFEVQFIKSSSFQNCKIVDLVIRTQSTGNKNSLSFPSTCERASLSPQMTLKHSIITTNKLLLEERSKLKKTKKEMGRKLNGLRQEIDQIKGKIASNVSQDEKTTFKIDNLKNTLQQAAAHVAQLEATLYDLTAEEVPLKAEYLKSKEIVHQKKLEYNKQEALYNKDLQNFSATLGRLKHEIQQASTKKEKLLAKQEKLITELQPFDDQFLKFKDVFTKQYGIVRNKFIQLRLREANELEMEIKGLEQDISRLEEEYAALNHLMQPVKFSDSTLILK